MKHKTLAAANTHLRSEKSVDLIARNLASSTSVETQKSPQVYLDRYQNADREQRRLKLKSAQKPPA